MQAISKVVKGLAALMLLAIQVAAPAAPVTLQFTGTMVVNWPGAPLGTPFSLSLSYDPAEIVASPISASEAYFVQKPPAQPYPAGTALFTAGSFQVTGIITTIYVKDGGAGEDDVVDIYSYLAPPGNIDPYSVVQFEILGRGKDWFSGFNLPLNGSYFAGAESLTLSASPAGKDPTFNAPAVAVPEPGSLALTCLGLTVAAALRRRKWRPVIDAT